MGLFNFIALLPIIISLVAIILYSTETIHFVYQGHLGLYSIGGALLT